MHSDGAAGGADRVPGPGEAFCTTRGENCSDSDPALAGRCGPRPGARKGVLHDPAVNGIKLRPPTYRVVHTCFTGPRRGFARPARARGPRAARSPSRSLDPPVFDALLVVLVELLLALVLEVLRVDVLEDLGPGRRLAVVGGVPVGAADAVGVGARAPP